MQISGHYGFKGAQAAIHFHDAAIARWSRETGFSARLDAGECTVWVQWVVYSPIAAYNRVYWLDEYFAEVGGSNTYQQFDLDAVDE